MNYDPKDVNVIIDGSFAVGLGEDMVSAEQDDESFEAHYGAQGNYSIAESHDMQGTITLSFQQNSPTLKTLRKMHNQRKHFPCFIQDKNEGNQVKAGGSDCRVAKAPDVEFSNEIEEIEVEIKVFDYEVK